MATASETRVRSIALLGNPNTGKSTLFSALSGLRQRVGNYPGVTVEKKLGTTRINTARWDVLDLPGTYSLAPRSPDEMVTVDVLLGRQKETPRPDVVLCVIDANNLERNLYLFSQVRELGVAVVVALTMTDVAESRGNRVDVEKLAKRLGVPVIPVLAHRGRGIDALKQSIAGAADTTPSKPSSPFPEAFQDEVETIRASFEELAASDPRTPAEEVPIYLIERLLLDVNGYLEHRINSTRQYAGLNERLQESRKRLQESGYPVPAVEAIARYSWASSTVKDVITCEADPNQRTLSDRLDRILTDRVVGTLVLVALMVLIFQAVFAGATPAMDLIDQGVGWVAEFFGRLLPEGPLQGLVVNGVIAGVGGVVIFLPQIFILFFFIGILEDCGYLSRAAYLMDRLMSRVGLSGKSFIPLLSSFACAIPGIMAARVIENRRDRMTTILVAPLMSCSARLPVYTLLIAAFVPPISLAGVLSVQAITMVSLYVLGVVTAALVALVLKRTAFRGPTPPFVMELSPFKWPSARVVLYRMVDRGWGFIKRAGTMIVAVSILMWALLYYPRLPDSTAEAVQGSVQTELERLEEARSTAVAENDPEEVAQLDATIGAMEQRLAARLDGEQKRQSLLGRAGRLIEPVVKPLGWDWRIGAASIASFPAREVVVATLGVIFDVGEEVEDEAGTQRLQTAIQAAEWPDGRPLFNLPVALSILVFFALCAQCVSTLAVIYRETNNWLWPLFSFAYMTILAYLGALVAYQIGTLFI